MTAPLAARAAAAKGTMKDQPLLTLSQMPIGSDVVIREFDAHGSAWV